MKIKIPKINKIKINFKLIGIIIFSIVFAFGIFVLGIYLGYNNRPEIEKISSVINKETEVETTADFSSFWKAWNVLKQKSIYSDKVTDQDRVWGAIEGLASSMGDPYTTFFKPKEDKLFKDDIKGSFSGIGAEIGKKDGILTIIAPLKGTPAEKAGLKKGDKILKIDKTSATNISVDDALNLIRGPRGTPVILTVIGNGENKTREVTITRDIIEVPTIDTSTVDDIFVIKFYSFSENADGLFADALNDFVKTKSHKLILDLRGNPGGYLDVAINIASWFVDEGKIIVSEDFGNNKKAQLYRSHGPRVFSDKLQFVVLIDGGSASASEILAGALKEYGIATLVGEKTFGKGSVQELINITPDTSLKVTVANWLTPKGVSISTSGLEPNIKIPLTVKDYENNLDPQMDKAVEILKAKE